MSTNDEPQSATKRLQCAQCPKSFLHRHNLQEHILLKHTEDKSKSSFPCEKCLETNQPPKSFATKRFLQDHIRRVHGPHPFQCTLCFKTFHQLSTFQRHQRVHFKQVGGHKCSLCSRFYNYKAALKRHLLNVHKTKTEGVNYLKCELCASEFAIRSDLENHVVEKHVVDKAFECPVCSKTFIDQPTLDKHIPSHDTKIKYSCDICSNGFKHKKSLAHHLKVKHLKFFYCDKCSRSFGNKSEYDQHSDQSETGISSDLSLEFKCQICNESFDSQCSLDVHTNSHLKEISSENQDEIKNIICSTKNLNLPMPILPDAEKLNLECELCSKVFDRQSYLQVHRNLVHSNAVWTCSFEECSKTFKQNYQLRLHKLTHVGKAERKPFVCRICQKSFHALDYLKKHEKTHAQNKKYKCGSCPKSFFTFEILRVHIANHHGGPKPFKCPIFNCGKASASSYSLKLHLATHQTEKFKCDLCTKQITFKSLRHLQRHRRRVHSGNNPSQTQKPTNSEASDAAVFICTSKECSFETVSEKEVAIHYSEQHGLPKVVISPSRIGPKIKNNKVVNSSFFFSSWNASSEIKDAESRFIQIRYKCRFCERLFQWMASFRSHRRTHLSN